MIRLIVVVVCVVHLLAEGHLVMGLLLSLAFVL